MCLDPNPLSHQLHLKDLEARFLARSYDHSNPPLSGWRAERQQALFAEQTVTPTNRTVSEIDDAVQWIKWIARLRGFWGKLRVTN